MSTGRPPMLAVACPTCAADRGQRCATGRPCPARRRALENDRRSEQRVEAERQAIAALGEQGQRAVETVACPRCLAPPGALCKDEGIHEERLRRITHGLDPAIKEADLPEPVPTRISMLLTGSGQSGATPRLPRGARAGSGRPVPGPGPPGGPGRRRSGRASGNAAAGQASGDQR